MSACPLVDCHTHTSFSAGHASIEDNVRAAAAAGCRVMVSAEHLTLPASMDAFCDPGGIVKLAHRMGHPAIAITDHGVCQGYPEAMLAADAIHKTDPDFKLIYGCEAYFVDDMIPCVYGVKDEPLNGEFCVFDTETTGLAPGVE